MQSAQNEQEPSALVELHHGDRLSASDGALDLVAVGPAAARLRISQKAVRDITVVGRAPASWELYPVARIEHGRKTQYLYAPDTIERVLWVREERRGAVQRWPRQLPLHFGPVGVR